MRYLYNFFACSGLFILLAGCSPQALHEHNLKLQQENLRNYGIDMSLDDIDKLYPEWRRLERNRSKPRHTKNV